MSQLATRVIGAEYWVRSACPSCGAPASRSAPAVASDPPAESLPIDQHTGFVSSYGPRRVFFTYFCCSVCELLFCPVFYSEEQLARLYGHQGENMAEAPFGARVQTQERYAQHLLKHSRKGGAFLEVGADVGVFARRCLKEGRYDHAWLYEPNLAIHDELGKHLMEQPHTIKAEMWPTDDVPAGCVSTAAMIHVVDHLLDPLTFLSKLRDKLEVNGVVLLVTHDAHSLLARTLGRRWPPFALQHPQLYCRQSMATLLQRSGFAIVEMRKAVNYFPVIFLVRAALSVLGLPSILPHIAGPSIPIKLGNMAVVVRRIEV